MSAGGDKNAIESARKKIINGMLLKMLKKIILHNK